jgi:GntR family transcriptional regulator, arabinose operon transcriptional repressor
MATTRWKEITDALELEIVQGARMPGDRVPTEEEIATLHGVSRVTAHRAIRELQAKGLVVRQRRWGTVVAERSNVKTKRIGLIFDVIDPGNSFPQPGLLRGIQAGITDEYSLVLCDSQNDPKREAELLAKMSDECDGIVLLPTSAKENTSLLQGIVKRGIPLVLLDRVPEGVKAPVVLSDNYAITRSAIDHLTARGHRRVGFLSFNKPTVSTVKDRLRAYQDALKVVNAGQGEDLVRFLAAELEHTHDRRFGQAVKDAVHRLVLGPQAVTAIFCVQDMFVPEVLDACLEAGKRVPEDIEVTSFNDLPPMMLRKPWAIHRIVPRVYEIGRAAGEKLVKQMSGEPIRAETVQVHADFHPADSEALTSKVGDIHVESKT